MTGKFGRRAFDILQKPLAPTLPLLAKFDRHLVVRKLILVWGNSFSRVCNTKSVETYHEYPKILKKNVFQMHALFREVSQALLRPATGFMNSIRPVCLANKQAVSIQQAAGPSK